VYENIFKSRLFAFSPGWAYGHSVQSCARVRAHGTVLLLLLLKNRREFGKIINLERDGCRRREGAKTKKRKKEKRHTRTDFERKHGERVAAVPQGKNFLLRVVGPAFAAASIIALFIVAEMMIHGRVRRRISGKFI
jgi:hypothetical protein